MIPWRHIEDAAAAALAAPFRATRREPLAGGCINRAYRIGDGERDLFVKLNDAHRADMFEAEAAGLAQLAAAGVLRVPAPIAHGRAGSVAYLVTEHLRLVPLDSDAAARLGGGLAQMHRTTREEFGWVRDNFIGSSPQCNEPSASWPEFLRSRRLGYQLDLAARNGYASGLEERGGRLLERLDAFFSDYSPRPSLLHGDLWSGNCARDEAGQPALFDPAVYYGDREADVAMTELFGRLPQAFYSAYGEAWPMDEGYPVRRRLYNLYHVLNHLNLFGPAYLQSARDTIEALLGELG